MTIFTLNHQNVFSTYAILCIRYLNLLIYAYIDVIKYFKLLYLNLN